jgi:hypothetical protein
LEIGDVYDLIDGIEILYLKLLYDRRDV